MHDVKKFKRWLGKQGLAEDTVDKYYRICVKYLMCGYDVKKPESIAAFMSGKRVYNYKYALKYLYRWLKKTRVYNDFADKYKGKFKLKGRRKVKKHVSKQRVKEIISFLPRPYDLMARLQYECCLRSKALLGLKKADVEIEDNGDVYINVIEKGNRRFRIYVFPTTARELIQHMDETDGSLFDIPLSYYNKELNKAGLELVGEKISSHWLRTSRMVHARKDGKGILWIKENLARHKSVNTTARYLASMQLDSKQAQQDLGGLDDK